MERTTFLVAVMLLIERDGKILLIRRHSQSSFSPDWYCVPMGHLDGNESVAFAAAREMTEEVGIRCDPQKDLQAVHVGHKLSSGQEYLNFFFKVLHFEGEPYNAEPNKHSEIGWFDIKNLPEKTVHREILNHIFSQKDNSFYSAWGFKQ